MSAEVSYTMFSKASDVLPRKRTHESYKMFMIGLRGEDAKRMRKYIGQIARELVPLENELLSGFVARVGVAAKLRFDGPKSVSPMRIDSPPRVASEKKKTKRRKSPSPQEHRPKARAKQPTPDPFEQMVKMFEKANMTTTTVKNAIAARPIVKTSRQQAVEQTAAKKKEQEKIEKEHEKERKAKKLQQKKDRKEIKEEADTLANMFNFKLGGH